MTYPIDEHALEAACNEVFRRAGYWAHHMDTTVLGFPDSLIVSRETSPQFVEYKYIRERDLRRPMVKLFQEAQPAQFVDMIQSGARITLIAFHVWAVYFGVLTIEKILQFNEQTAIEWLDEVNSLDYAEMRKIAKEIRP
jgi:hypothetical protein